MKLVVLMTTWTVESVVGKFTTGLFRLIAVCSAADNCVNEAVVPTIT